MHLDNADLHLDNADVHLDNADQWTVLRSKLKLDSAELQLDIAEVHLDNAFLGEGCTSGEMPLAEILR